MDVLITGAAGFLGQELAVALVDEPNIIRHLTLTDLVEPTIPPSLRESGVKIKSIALDLTKPEAREALFGQPFHCVYLLHGIMSGAAEANLDLGLKVNLHATMCILDKIRRPDTLARADDMLPKVIYASVGAVYGPAQPGEVVSEQTLPLPQSSYGSQKLMIETLINDYSRRGLIDGRICRLPTVTVRAGAPTGAASSFASSIFREPLAGKRATLPVSRDQSMFITSPQTVIKNLLHASQVPKEQFGMSRVVLLPGIKVSVQQMLDVLEEVGGRDTLAFIDEKPEGATNRIVSSWASDWDTPRAFSMGFHADMPLLENVQAYFKRYVKTTSN